MSSTPRHESPPNATLSLTPRQQMLWIDDALHPGLPCNHVTTRLTIDGPLDADRFAAAFAAVAAAHDVFALRFVPARDGAALAAGAAGAARLQRADVGPTPTAFAAWLEPFLRPAFGFDEPLWRAALVRCGPARTEFVLSQHHAITDSQSCLLLVQALATAYAGGAVEAPASQLAAMLDTHAYLATPAAAHAAEFWRRHLDGAPLPGRLYGRERTDKGPSTLRVHTELSAALTAAIDRRGLGASPAQVFAAATFAWLQRVGEGEEFVLGVPLLNRAAGFRATAGLLMEIVPNRVAVTATMTFRELLAAVAAEVERVRPHRRLPVGARQARTDVLLNVHGTAPVEFAGLPCRYELTTPMNLIPAAAFAGDRSPWENRESVTVQVHRHGADGAYELGLDLDRGLFPAEAGARALRHLAAVLEHGLATPDLPIGRLPLLDAAERSRALVRGPTLGAVPPPTLTALFLAVAGRHPERPALRHRDVVWTYRQLEQRTAVLAGRLRRAGVIAGDRVAVCLRRSPDLPAVLLACARLGATYVPLDPSHPGARLQLILEDASPRLLVADADGRAALGSTAGNGLDLDAPPPPDDGEPFRGDEARADAVAYVLFTSGSTGRPKGVEVLHHGLGAFLLAMQREPGCAVTDRLLAVTTIGFDIAALELFLPLTVGAEVVLADRQDAQDPQALERLLTTHDITVLQATPATFQLLLQNGWTGKRDLRVLVGGEALPVELANALLERTAALWNMYGPTETTVWSLCTRVGARRPIAIGRPIAGTSAYVLNGLREPVPIGVPGELWLAGDGVARGYLARPELTGERFAADPFAGDRTGTAARMYCTGDLARLADDGQFEFLGRTDFQVKIRGYRIELGEIEAVLAAHPQVQQAVVVARGSGKTAELHGYVVRRDGAADAAAIRELETFLRERLPVYMVPARLGAIAAFPLTPSGKVDRKALPELQAPAPTARTATAPRTPFEARIAALWAAVLSHPRADGGDYDLDDDFFAVGGHSLPALELARRLQDELGLGIDVGAIFRHPTLRQQAALAAGGGGAAAASVVTLEPGAADRALPPIYAVCGIHLYAELARRLQPRRPVHAVYVPNEQFGAAMAPPPIEQLAAAYWERIAAHRPPGRFDLLGFCYGGMVAYEVARLARAAGAEVGVVVLIDTALWTGMRRDRVRQVWHRLRRAIHRSPVAPPATAPAAPGPVAVVDTRGQQMFGLSRDYRPRGRFDGRCILVRVEDSELLSTWKATPMLGWEPWVGPGSACVRVAATHDTMLRLPAVTEVGKALAPLL